LATRIEVREANGSDAGTHLGHIQGNLGMRRSDGEKLTLTPLAVAAAATADHCEANPHIQIGRDAVDCQLPAEGNEEGCLNPFRLRAIDVLRYAAR